MHAVDSSARIEEARALIARLGNIALPHAASRQHAPTGRNVAWPHCAVAIAHAPMVGPAKRTSR